MILQYLSPQLLYSRGQRFLHWSKPSLNCGPARQAGYQEVYISIRSSISQFSKLLLVLSNCIGSTNTNIAVVHWLTAARGRQRMLRWYCTITYLPPIATQLRSGPADRGTKSCFAHLYLWNKLLVPFDTSCFTVVITSVLHLSKLQVQIYYKLENTSVVISRPSPRGREEPRIVIC